MLQMVLSGGMGLLVAAMLLMFVRVTMVSQQLTTDQHNAELIAWRPMHRLADNLRKAQIYGSQMISAGTATTVTIYDDTSGNTSYYWLDSIAIPHTLNRTRGLATQTLATGMTSLQFTYYLATGKTPAQGACWVTTANPHAPTTAELPNVVAVGITITMPLDGSTRTMTSVVRLRNGSRSISGQ